MSKFFINPPWVFEQVFMEQPPEYVAQGSHLRWVSCKDLFMGSSRVHALDLQSLLVFSLPLASHHARHSYRAH